LDKVYDSWAVLNSHSKLILFGQSLKFVSIEFFQFTHIFFLKILKIQFHNYNLIKMNHFKELVYKEAV